MGNGSIDSMVDARGWWRGAMGPGQDGNFSELARGNSLGKEGCGRSSQEIALAPMRADTPRTALPKQAADPPLDS